MSDFTLGLTFGLGNIMYRLEQKEKLTSSSMIGALAHLTITGVTAPYFLGIDDHMSSTLGIVISESVLGFGYGLIKGFNGTEQPKKNAGIDSYRPSGIEKFTLDNIKSIVDIQNGTDTSGDKGKPIVNKAHQKIYTNTGYEMKIPVTKVGHYAAKDKIAEVSIVANESGKAALTGCFAKANAQTNPSTRAIELARCDAMKARITAATAKAFKN